jgi:hypothetical protein
MSELGVNREINLAPEHVAAQSSVIAWPRLTTRRLFQLVLLAALFALAARNITDGDFWWHLSTGQYILATHSIPHADIFSYTRAGQAWVTHEWLSQVLIAALYQVGGFGALIVAFAGIIAAAFFIAFRRSAGNLLTHQYADCRGQACILMRQYVSAFVTLLGAVSTMVVWDVRPQMISLLLTSLCLWILDRYRRDETTRAVWLLLPLMLLWVNFHGSFPVGLALVALYLLAGVIEWRWRVFGEPRLSPRGLARLALVLGLMLLVIPLNPNGVRLYTYPFETLNDPIMQSQIAEWQSPDFHRLDMQPFAWLILATFAALAYTRRRFSLTQILVLAAALFEGLHSVRLMPLFALVAIPILSEAIPIAPRVANTRARNSGWLNWSILVVVMLVVALYAGRVAQNQAKTERAAYPTEAVAFIQREHLTAPMFNLYEWGGYLIWRLYPERRVFIDGRADVYGALIQDYLASYRAAPNWRTVLDRYGVGLVLIPPDAPLATVLAEDPNWSRAFQDKQAVIFLRR